MAGGVNAGVRRWWDAPATLEVLETPEGYVRAVTKGFLRFGAIGALLGVPVVAATDDALQQAAPVAALMALPFVALLVFLWAHVASVHRVLVYGAVVMVAGGVGAWLGFFGPDRPSLVVIVPAATAVVTVWVPRRWALVAVTVGYALLVAILMARGIDDLVPFLLPIGFFSYLVLFELSWMLDRVADLSEQERAAQAEVQRLAAAETEARVELAELNRTLEERVQAQVGEIEGLGRLRRFLSPQVADAVVADALAPHRREIAVVFCDLRGFTQFANTCDPEELLEVLDAYHDVVGRELRAHEATVGALLGDGIMAYFNDPVPCDDSCGTAVSMALALRVGLDDQCRGWQRRGIVLGWGIGIAYGYATLGAVGFEGRSDYTPLGAVVNLASRLCDEAGHGEILLDGRAHHAIDGRYPTEATTADLKGFDDPVVAYRLS